MRRLPKKGGMWEYLDQVGILENGTDAEIKAAKKAYRKNYFRGYKREQRMQKPEYTISFAKDNGDFETVLKGARKHKLSVPSFIRQATLAYINQTFIVPNREEVAHLEQLLSDCLNEIQTIVRFKEQFNFQREEKLEKIEKRIEKLEQDIDRLFRYPKLQ